MVDESQLHPKRMQLKMTAPDGRKRLTDCANTEGVLRIAMSVPSPKAEPLKLWLAQVGVERIEETEDPELLSKRQAELYRAKGFIDNHDAAHLGGQIGGKARMGYEQDTGLKVLSSENFLGLKEGEKPSELPTKPQIEEKQENEILDYVPINDLIEVPYKMTIWEMRVWDKFLHLSKQLSHAMAKVISFLKYPKKSNRYWLQRMNAIKIFHLKILSAFLLFTPKGFMNY